MQCLFLKKKRNGSSLPSWSAAQSKPTRFNENQNMSAMYIGPKQFVTHSKMGVLSLNYPMHCSNHCWSSVYFQADLDDSLWFAYLTFPISFI